MTTNTEEIESLGAVVGQKTGQHGADSESFALHLPPEKKSALIRLARAAGMDVGSYIERILQDAIKQKERSA